MVFKQERPYQLLPSRSLHFPVPDERAIAILFKSNPEFILCVHNDWAIPGYWFTDGLAGYQQEPYRVSFSRDHDLIAIVKQDKGLVTNKRVSLHIEIVNTFDIV